MSQQIKFLIDPPSGHLYGFPKEWDGKQDLDTILREAGYPENDIAFAKAHMWVTSIETPSS